MNKLVIPFVIVLSLITGCASVPMASDEADNRAKQFEAPEGKANIYLYRNEAFGGAITLPISFNKYTAGVTAPYTFFLWTVDPGEHVVTSHTEDTITLKVNAEAGKNYFIWQEVKMGAWRPNSALHLMSEKDGREGVLECNLAQPIQ